MGYIYFGWLSMKMPKDITIGSCVTYLSYLIKYVLMCCLAGLGLFTPLEEDTYNSDDTNLDNVVMIFDRSCPSLVPVPVRALISSIKKNLPIISFGDHCHLKLRGKVDFGKDGEEIDEEEVSCGVCLDFIETHQEIRELSNCKHLFHMQCLDRWMDEGQFCCPFCRSMLLPPSINPWTVIQNNQ